MLFLGKGDYQCETILHTLWHAEKDAWAIQLLHYQVKKFNMIQVNTLIFLVNKSLVVFIFGFHLEQNW